MITKSRLFIKIFSAVLFIFLYSCANNEQKRNAYEKEKKDETKTSEEISGTYSLIKNKDSKDRIGDVTILYLSSDSIRVQMNINIGPPSYNSGFLNPSTAYKTKEEGFYTIKAKNYADSSKTCNILLEFKDYNLTVKQISDPSDCGFGSAVYANGLYRKSDNNTVFGSMKDGSFVSEK